MRQVKKNSQGVVIASHDFTDESLAEAIQADSNLLFSLNFKWGEEEITEWVQEALFCARPYSFHFDDPALMPRIIEMYKEAFQKRYPTSQNAGR